MGRVRRYKKYKAIDPFAKGHTRAESDLVHDEPPSVHDDRGRKRKSRGEGMGEDEIMRREGYRVLKEERIKKAKIGERKVEPKNESESMKEFKTRIRNETRKVLHDELKGMTATAQKRKLRLKERKVARKTKGTVVEDVPDFMMAENGTIRPSDRGGPDDFKQLAKQRFGETGERPPDLSHFSIGKPKQAAPMIHPLFNANADQPKQAATAGAKFLERQQMREDREKFIEKEKTPVAAKPAAGLSLKELVKARESAQEAYAALRQKRMAAAAVEAASKPAKNHKK
jgi:hypothetical protein